MNGEKIAEGRIDHTQPMIFSADETADVGIDLATPVVETIGSEHVSKFTGTINSVTVEIENMDTKPLEEHTEAKHHGWYFGAGIDKLREKLKK